MKDTISNSDNTDRIDECKIYNPRRWTINTPNYKTSGTIEAETEEEARKVFLEEYDEYSDEDIEYCRPTGRYNYSVTEEGVQNPKYAEKFSGGRVEVFDNLNDSGYAVYEWRFLMPWQALGGFIDWIEDVETDYPIMINADFNMDTLEYEF